ncbi:RagB/SusD family nutrient uptake outer membrane protein [Prolixibacteraceae bacterium Z1-6]|uniref:RagB/SusD family nutrient uptake outer membrane protein n=1 Tax=Draconibacterium aestuarii TaxID=2998507 RepID=A0A9X3J829_9BACT|nr:RagB/SusD family nutrient uptake outer membrane protein [Prolixibacteraceae bacterium Z1-6]
MKKMKFKYILYTLAVFLSTSACQDFLDPESLSTFDSEYIFSNADDARKAVNAMYVHYSHDGFRSRLSNNMTGNTDIEHAGGSSDGARYQIWRLDAQENNGDLAYVWNIGYQAIRDANIAIEGISASEALNSNDVALSNEMYHLLGEAYTMRAYWYSMLIFYFGDVPFSTQAPAVDVEFNLPKEDRNVILSTVIQDLIDIEEKMKWADDTRYGIEQINREYTLGMIARLALQRGGYYLTPELSMARESDYLDYYKIARDYSNKLMTLKDRDLPEDFRQIFMNQCKFISPVNEDILFEVPFAIGRGDVAWNIGIRVDGGNHEYGSGSNYMAMPPTYLYSFDAEDKRLPVTCGLYTINSDFIQELVSSGSMNISQGKWSRHFLDTPPGRTTAKGTGINWPMLRYSDVILMFAEAENEINGPTAEAQAALKRVRQRAFDEAVWNTKVDQYVSTASANKESFFDAIVDERAWEFGGEMIRKYELIRWNLYSEKINETVEGCKQMADEALAGTGTLPDYLYTKLDETGNLVILNLHEKLIAPPDDSWERESWLISMSSETTTDGYAEWMTRDWDNYVNPGNIGVPEGVIRYIFPIPTIGIDNSKGLLKNDGYNFGY